MQPLWTPSPERVAQAQLTRFRQAASSAAGRSLPDYDALWAWSVEEPASFWALMADFADIRFHTPPQTVLGAATMPGATWFVGARLNYAENLLHHPADHRALVAVDETGRRQEVTYGALTQQVARFQHFLRAQGVGVGDRVAAWMPNRIETVVAMLAAAGLGAVFSSSSPDFGIKGVLDRFGQIQPKVLIASDGAVYGGKRHDQRGKLADIVSALGNELNAVVVVDVIGADDLSGVAKVVRWTDAASTGPDVPHFEPLPFDHPLYIMYSSGTTGVPKCIVHGAGGTLLQHAKEHLLHTNVTSDDVVFYFTTCGWMMWNWLVGGLVTGATLVLWDGSPVHPGPDALWRLAEAEGITVFGTSPKFLSMCDKEGVRPAEQFNLSALQSVLSTGAPLSVEGFRWVYDAVKADVQLASIAGGTDIISCFMLGCPTEPVYPGEIQKRGLGMAVEAWSDAGTPLVGEKGELVCTRPFVSMPVGFWNDPDGARYHHAYFDHFPGVWRHGDFVEITPRGGVIVYGRSDATLNPGGVRIGTAEIYRPVEAMEEVLECVVVGLPTEDADVEVVLFVVLAEGVAFDDALIRTLRTRIRTLASPRHVPARIFAAPGVPRTISGKKVEMAIAKVLAGQAAPNRDAMANPEVLDWYATEGRDLLAG